MQTDQYNILVFDTTTVACTVALKCSSGIYSRHLEVANIHSQKLLLMIDEILFDAGLKLADLDYLAVGIGPGSFTGLRIGIGVAQALSYSHNISVIPLSSLEILAVSALNCTQQLKKGVIFVAHDARMSEVYHASYDVDLQARLILRNEVSLCSPERLNLSLLDDHESASNLILCGNAWCQYSDRMPEIHGDCILLKENIVPNAKQVVTYIEQYISEFAAVDWQELAPVYVRNDIAKKSTQKMIK